MSSSQQQQQSSSSSSSSSSTTTTGVGVVGGSSIRSTSLIRSKSLRLPSTRRSDHSPSPSNLTRHGSMRLPRPSTGGGPTSINTSSSSTTNNTNSASSTTAATNTAVKKPQPPPIKPKPSFIDRLGEKMHTITGGGNKQQQQQQATTGHKNADTSSTKAMTLPRLSMKSDRDHSTSAVRSVSIDAPLTIKEQNAAAAAASANNKEQESSKDIGLDAIHLYRRLTEEHEKLQMEYARLRMQHMDNTASKLSSASSQCLRKDPNNLHTAYSDTHLDTIPEDAPTALNRLRFGGVGGGEEKPNYNEDYVQQLESLVQGYRAEVLRVQDEARKMQRKYWDKVMGTENIESKGAESGKQVLELLDKQEEAQKEITQLSTKIQEIQSQLSSCNQELQQCHNALQDYQYQIDGGEHERKVLALKLRDSQTDLSEARESVEFLQAERTALAESLQEAELNLNSAKTQLDKDNAALRDLSLRNRKLYSKVLEKNSQLQLLQTDLESTQGRARDMLLSQGAELTMGAVAISHLSSRVHSVLSSTLEYAAIELGLDKEIHYEINDDFDEVEEDLVGSDFRLSSSSSLDKISKVSMGGGGGVGTCGMTNGKTTSAGSTPDSLSPIDPDGPGGKSTSLVQSIIQALEQSTRTEKCTGGNSSTPTSPNKGALTLTLKENGDSEPSKGKPVGTATAFRCEESEKGVIDETSLSLMDVPPKVSNGDCSRAPRDDEASLEGQAKHANAMLNKLVSVLSLVQKNYATKVKEYETKICKLKTEMQDIDDQKKGLEIEIGSKTALNDELAGKLGDALREISLEKGKQETELDTLREQVQDLKTKCHSLEAMNAEQAHQMKEEVQKLVKMSGPNNSMGDAMAICDKLVLKQEIARLKEVLKEKDDILKRLAAKFARHKKVWEENYQKAEGEVQKLDLVVEKVIEVLETLPEMMTDSEPLTKLLEQLKSGSLYRELNGADENQPPKGNRQEINERKKIEQNTAATTTTTTGGGGGTITIL